MALLVVGKIHAERMIIGGIYRGITRKRKVDSVIVYEGNNVGMLFSKFNPVNAKRLIQLLLNQLMLSVIHIEP